MALFTRVLWAAILMQPAFAAQAGVVLTSLYSFPYYGTRPEAGLAAASDGNFYGTTYAGGSLGFGGVFKISPNGAFTNVYSFTNGYDGEYPMAAVLQGSDGALYGTASSGGGEGGRPGQVYAGTVFKISTNGALTKLYSFTGFITIVETDSEGGDPKAPLAQGSDGSFYGTTQIGGSRTNSAVDYGTVFKIDTNGTLISLYSFTNGNDGAYPVAGLVQGANGNFYGAAQFGGISNAGTVFEISSNGMLTGLYSFTNGYDGRYPVAALVQGNDGNFYGTTESGTNGGYGTIFKIRANGTLTSLYSFTGGNDGANPEASLLQGSDGNFYGTTSSGGTNGLGTVFEWRTNGALTSLYSFTGYNDGANPKASLVQAGDGSFYGTTYLGGPNGGGTVFRLMVVPTFQAVTLANGMLSLTWSTEAGKMYQLQSSSDLSSSPWTNLGGAATANGATLSVTEAITNGAQRFYRVMLAR